MSSDARTLPPSGAPAVVRSPAGRRWLPVRRTRELAGAEESARIGVLALAAILVLSAFVVLVAANRPSILTPTTHGGYFPHWMAGPLGGLLPGFTTNSTALKCLFSGAIVVMYCCYLLLVSKHAARLPARWLIGAIAAVYAIFLMSPPLALTDLFNYVNYARMEVEHGLNPYATIPVLEPHSDPSFLLSNWHQLLSPYGQLFTLLTCAVVPLGLAVSFWTLKTILVLTSLATIALVWKCAQLLGRDPRVAIALVALNPIVLVWGLGGDHNDCLMVFCIMLGFYLLLRARADGIARALDSTGAPVAVERVGTSLLAREMRAGVPRALIPRALAANLRRTGAAILGEARSRSLREWLLPLSALELGAGAAFMTGAAIKASGAILFPVVLAVLLRTPRTLVQVVVGMIATGVLLVAASVLAFGLHVPDLATQSSLVTSESVPNLLGLAVGAGGESAGMRSALSVVLVLVVLACAWLAWERRDAVTASGWASVALLVTLSWVLPWYVLWVLPLAALSSSRRLRTTTLVLGVYLIVAWAPASGMLWRAIHFYPEKTPLGRLHHRYVKELLN
ncbi:MAG: hypothetical protein ACRDJX_01310 [Solirubrobacteraceae bacterium]